jgi:O-antigen ligase
MVARRHPLTITAMALLSGAAVVVIALVVAPDLLDRFRLIKEGAFRAEAILGLLLLTIAIAFGGSERVREILARRAVVAVAAAILLWTLITAATSTNRMLSAESLITVAASLVVFFLAWYAAPRMPLLVLDVLVPLAVFITIFAALQERGIWQPFSSSLPFYEQHLGSSATIGNPNIVGSYLAIVAIVLAAAALEVTALRRWLYALGAVAALAGVVGSLTRTAVIAAAVALVAIGFLRSWKWALVATVVIAGAFGIAAAAGVPAVKRITDIPQQVAQGRWDLAFTERVQAFLAAYEMWRAKPVTGVGPGAFKFNYMPYRIALEGRYDERLLQGGGGNFGETHNDHLQLLAETGVPGYLLFLAALVLLARRSGTSDDPRARVARAIGIPLAVVIFVLCIAQFPLQVAVTRHLMVTLAGLIIGWRNL